MRCSPVVTARRFQRFEVLEELGRGGSGAVYRARDPQLDREVAIKVLVRATRVAVDALATERTIDLRGTTGPDVLLHEARMMAKLSHPNVLPIYEVGVDSGEVFLVMEYIAGATLRRWRAEAHDDSARLAMLAQAARGLAAAHAHGIVHRDFKPDNVLIGADGRARVADFGLAGLLAPTAYVRVGAGAGTPRYMAPELWNGAVATARSDAFALCRTIAEVFGKHDDLAAVPDAVRALVERGVDDDPSMRPTASELVVALDRAATTATAPASIAPAATADATADATATPTTPAARTARPWSRAAIAGGGAAALLAALAVAFALRGGGTAAACGDGAALTAGSWGPDQRAALASALGTGSAAERVLAIYDADAADIVALHAQTCAAHGRGEVGDRDLERVDGCLARRAIEIAAAAALARDPRPSQGYAPSGRLAEAEDVARRVAPAASCAGMTAEPLAPAAVVPAIAQWSRYFATYNQPTDELVTAYGAIARDAAAIGEAELAGRAQVSRGIWERRAGNLTASDATIADGYRAADAIHDRATAAHALAERAITLARSADAAAAQQVAKLALDQAADATVPPRTRAQIYSALGRADRIRGELPAALDKLHDALAVIANNFAMPDIEAVVRIEIIEILRTQTKLDDALAYARDTVAFIRGAIGVDYVDYGVAMLSLGSVLSDLGDDDAALAAQREALDVIQRSSPDDLGDIALLRNNIGWSQYKLGHIDDARATFADLVATSDGVEALRSLYPLFLENFGSSTFDSGRLDDGLALLGRALDAWTALGGPVPGALAARGRIAVADLEVGRLDEAEAQTAILERAFAGHAEYDADLAIMRGEVRGGLALARGDARQARALAADADAKLVAEHVPEWARVEPLRVLGDSLIALDRYADARVPLEAARAITQGVRADAQACVQLSLAEAAAGLGDRDTARREATAARAALAAYPGRVRARREVDALLARLR